jgi:outer membrane protein assembly factor BamD
MKKLLCTLILVLLISCAGKDKIQIPSEKLYHDAMEEFKSNRLGQAIDGFKKLETRYNFEKYHEAMIMIAYGYYAMNDYSEMLLKIDSIKDLNLVDLEYVYYLQILGYYGKITESKRDLSMLKKLFACTNDMLKKFPNSPYIDDVLLKRRMVFEYIVESELAIAKYYIEDSNLIGALNHLKYLLDNYPENRYSAEIFYLMYKLYSHIEYVDGYSLYHRLLREKYGNTKWFKEINEKG